MKLRCKRRGRCGLTLIELLVIVFIVAILAALLFPPGPGHKRAAYAAACMSHLKQLSAAETMWAGDHGGKFPAQVSTNIAGTQEYLTNGQAGLHYRALEPYLGNWTSVLRCPSDKRVAATNFETLSNENVSYFASLDAGVSNTNWFLAGDRNLVSQGAEAKPGLLSLTTNSVLSWTKEMHSKRSVDPHGIVVFPDGHVVSLAEKRLAAAINSLGTQTNRLMFP